MPENVLAQVIVRSGEGSSILDSDEPITSENVEYHQVEKEVIENAAQKLREIGFEVVQTSEVGLTITGDKERFEEVFETTLEVRSEDADAGSGQEHSYEAKEPVHIPEELSPFVADLAFPTPPEFH